MQLLFVSAIKSHHRFVAIHLNPYEIPGIYNSNPIIAYQYTTKLSINCFIISIIIIVIIVFVVVANSIGIVIVIVIVTVIYFECGIGGGYG